MVVRHAVRRSRAVRLALVPDHRSSGAAGGRGLRRSHAPVVTVRSPAESAQRLARFRGAFSRAPCWCTSPGFTALVYTCAAVVAAPMGALVAYLVELKQLGPLDIGRSPLSLARRSSLITVGLPAPARTRQPAHRRGTS